MYCRSCLLATSESAISGNSDTRSIIFHPRLPRDQRGNGLLTKAQPVHDYFLPNIEPLRGSGTYGASDTEALC